MRNRPASVSPIVGMRASVLDALASVPMFATLGGSMPWPSTSAESASSDEASAGGAARLELIDGLVRDAIALQVAAGLEPVTDGGLRDADAATRLLGGLSGVVLRPDGAVVA